MEEFNEIMARRRSVRKFSSEKISEDKLVKIAEAATLAPTGMNKRELYSIALGEESTKSFEQLSEEILGMDRYYGAPNIILLFRDKNAGGLFDLDAGAAMENMLLKATELGIGSCWIHAARDLGKSDKMIERLHEMGISENLELIESIALGYGDKQNENNADERRVTFLA